MSISTRPLPGTTIDPRYPDTDGVPLGEADFHYLAVTHLHGALRIFYRGRTDVHVAADMFLYYEEDGKIKSRAPDVMVAMGVKGNHLRRSFRIREEGVAPAVIFEITSKKTHHEDEHEKKEIYARLGVKEYYLFEAEELGVINPRLQGFRLNDGKFAPLSADGAGRLVSQELGMVLEGEDDLLRLIDLRTGVRLMTLEEIQDAYDEAIESAQKVQRDFDHAREQVEQAGRRLEQADREADAERQRSMALEAEIARLRAIGKPPDRPR